MEEDKKKKTTSKKTTKKTTSKKVKKDDLDVTTRIRIDNDRINDVDSLDTSFMEGRSKNKVKKSIKAKENILKESKDYSGIINVFKVILFILIFIGICVFGFIMIKNSNISFKKEKTVTKKTIKKVPVVEDNYLFVGDFYVDDMNFDDFLYPYVKVSNKDYTTSDLLENINEDIYMYNPSDVFIELGINDLNGNVQEEDIVKNIEDIITGIKSNRSHANIYIESLYPINRDKFNEEVNIIEDIDNDTIVSLNKKIKELTKTLDVNYIDMYSELVEDNLLKEKYTEDGIHLNEDGYKRVFKTINQIVLEKHEENK